jgi:predicted GIY-YIG superfamily endonuclease
MSTGIFGLLMAPPVSWPQQDRFHYWQGASGQWVITTIYPLLSSHFDQASVYVMVRRDANGRAHPLYIGQTSDTARRMEEHFHDKVMQAIWLGGTELHLHFLAKSEAERFSIETDLRHGHNAPLNQQNGTAALRGIFGLGPSEDRPKGFLEQLAGRI